MYIAQYNNSLFVSFVWRFSKMSMKFWNTIKNLCDEKGTTPTAVVKELGLSTSMATRWKNGTIPNDKTLHKLADYFEVTTDALLGYVDIDSISNIQSVDEIVTFEEIGTISAGYNGQAIEEHTGKTIDLPVSMLKGHSKDDYFVLRVRGNSMYPKLLDGDSILCRKTASVDSGDIAVILYNGDEATVKKVNFVHGEDWIELIPINKDYEIMRIEGYKLEECRVLGRVVKLIRDF